MTSTNRYLCLGKAPWVHPAFVCSHADSPTVIHRCQGKWFAENADVKAAHLPGEERAWGYREQWFTGTGTAEEVFTRVYRRGLWRRGDASGDGSTAVEARPYLDIVNNLIRLANWKRVVDLGCGDGYITMRLQAREVTGVDCYLPHLERLRRQFPRRQWVHSDIDRDRESLPAGDCALWKDVAHHLPSSLLIDWLTWARTAGKWRWLLITADSANAVDGADCALGSYRPLSLSCRPLSQVSGLTKVCGYLHKSVWLMECKQEA